MPYWLNCIRCNKDGSYANVDRACGKCSGLGQDWRSDDEYEWASAFAKSHGLELHYEAELPKFNRSGERVYSSLAEYKEANEVRQPAGKVEAETEADDDIPAGDAVERFVSIYLQLRNQNTQLYHLNAPGEGSLTGAFNLFELDTRFPFINQEYLADTEREIGSLERKMDTMEDQFRPLEDDEMADFKRTHPEMFELMRAQELVAHENFHVLQVCALRTVFSLAQSYRTIDRWRNYFGVILLNSGVTFKEGECIFDALRHIPNYEEVLSTTLYDLSKRAKLALNAVKAHADGLSVMHLIEGSAFIAQKISLRTLAMPTFTVDDKPLYSGAWQIYQAHGGQDEVTFLLVCLAALRFGDIRSGYAHPVDIFLSLAKEAANLEATGAAAFSTAGVDKRFGHSNEPLPGRNEKYFWHLDVVDERQKAALAQCRNEANENVNGAVDMALNISRSIARHVKSHFDAVGAPVDKEQMSASYIDDFLRAYGMTLYKRFPAVNTEEFCLRYLFDASIQQAFRDCAEGAAGKTAVQEIGGNMLNGDQTRALSDIIQRFETLTLYNPLGNVSLPYCCELHPAPGGINVLIDCQREDSLNALMRQICEKELRELID